VTTDLPENLWKADAVHLTPLFSFLKFPPPQVVVSLTSLEGTPIFKP
jgi:hypothetical protein